MTTRAVYERAPRRMVVRCPKNDPIVATLTALEFHYEESDDFWWRGYSTLHEERLKSAMAALQRPAPTPISKPDEALVVGGDTYPVREKLAAFGAEVVSYRKDCGAWVARDRAKADELRLMVALESVRRLGLPPPREELQNPPPSFVLCGAVDEETSVALRKFGARWIEEWCVWSIHADKERTMAALAIARNGGAPKRDQAKQAPPWVEPELAPGAFRLAFLTKMTDRAPLSQGEKCELDGSAAEVVASGVEFGKGGSANRIWIHLRFIDPSRNGG